ncbi:MAG: DUF3800 domain-containing protein [Egibacteraceae bacterium]
MLVFVDESGHPNPGDPCSRPVLMAVCVQESDAGRLIRRLYALRRDLQGAMRLLGFMKLSKAEEELKAVEILTRRALLKNAAKKELFMARTTIGRSMSYILPSPLFADSSLTPGLQIADLFAYALRVNYENNLRLQRNLMDPYLSCMARYGRIIHEKTINYSRAEGGSWYGIGTMSADKFIYDIAEVIPQLAGTEEPE